MLMKTYVALLLLFALSARAEVSDVSKISAQLPAELTTKLAPELAALRRAQSEKSNLPTTAAKEFAAAISQKADELKAKKISGGDFEKHFDAEFKSFKAKSQLVKLNVTTEPADAQRYWKPLFGGDWVPINDGGSYVGYGYNLVRVSKPGFKTSEERLETKSDPTEKTIALQPEPNSPKK